MPVHKGFSEFAKNYWQLFIIIGGITVGGIVTWTKTGAEIDSVKANVTKIESLLVKHDEKFGDINEFIIRQDMINKNLKELLDKIDKKLE